MRLINFGLGELTDRLTILALKILVGAEAGKDVAHFEKERAVLLTQASARTLGGPWLEGALELAAVNGLLWHAEDDLRAWRAKSTQLAGALNADHDVEIVDLAFRIQALNDRRADLIAILNKDAGDAAGPEKLT